ncbi:MAG: adenylate/guanylate cyclase domain-containing protein [Nitrospinae bacterium]|nr:adenylate/guanylate cyclase domain-containing protein [Nitrospinota bacterium]
MLKKLLKLTPFKIVLAITAIVIALYSSDPPFMKFLEFKSFDLRFIYRGVVKPGDEVAIAVIDEKSLDELGKWPWPRNIQAELINKLTQKGVKVIGFDAVFSEPDINPGLKNIGEVKKRLAEDKSVNPELIKLVENAEKESNNDIIFADALKKSQNTILGYFLHFTKEGLEHVKKEVLDASVDNIRSSQYNAVRFASPSAQSVQLQEAYAVEASIKPLSESAKGAGFFSFISDDDGAIRKVPLIVRYNDMLFPPLSIQMLKEYLETDISFNIEDYGVDEVQLGDIVIPTDERGAMLINYYGPQKAFPHYSITDIIHDRIPAELLQDRMVLVGPTALGIYDLRITPFQQNYPGVEIHATIIDNIFQQNFIIRPDWMAVYDIAVIILLGIILSILLPRLKAIYAGILMLILSAAYLELSYYFFIDKGLWINIVYPLSETFSVYVGITVYRYATEEKEKKFIKGAFSQYLAPAVINQLIDNPKMLELGGEEKILTAFFSDIKGFSTFSEKLTPKELVHLLNLYLTEMTDIVLDHSGTVDKFVGDAIVAFFGAPVRYDDHAKRACYAALEIQKKSVELRERWKKEGNPEVYTRIGLNTGPMVVGNMGTMRKMNYTIMGDAVNLASRLEGANKPYGTYIMLGESTYNAAKDFIEARELDSIRVMGKKEPVRVYELIAKKGEIAQQKRDAVESYNTGLSYYKQRRWRDAALQFDKALQIDAADGPSKTYIARCGEFSASPPPEDWDGVYVMKEK